MGRKSTRMFFAAIGITAFMATAVYADRLFCNLGTQLSGGVSDTSTVTAGTTFAYTVYATDKDQPQVGGAEVMDKGLWVSDHIINSIPIHDAPETQGDDAAAGKRTFTVSGVAAEPSAPGENVIYEDQFKFDDGVPNQDDRFAYANDGQTAWYTKTVIVQVPPVP